MKSLIAFLIVTVLFSILVSTQFYVEIKNSMPRIGRNSVTIDVKSNKIMNLEEKILRKLGKLWFQSRYEDNYLNKFKKN